METKIQSENFEIDYKDTQNIALTKQLTLRRLVGTLGMFLPVLLLILLFITDKAYTPLDSISHYFYTQIGSVFIVIVSSLAVFLLVYKGYEQLDFWISTFAGLFALCVAFFPTDNISKISNIDCNSCAVTLFPISPFREGFHFFSAAIFLSCLAFMSLFLFTKSDHKPHERTHQKNTRNLIFKLCGIVMIAAMAVIALGGLSIIKETFYIENHLTFWMEVIALEAFAVSWFVKGEVVLKDK